MQIPKDKILELLRSRGDQDKANQAEGELPDQVDTDRDVGLLQKFGIDPSDLLGQFGGGDIGKKLGLEYARPKLPPAVIPGPVLDSDLAVA